LKILIGPAIDKRGRTIYSDPVNSSLVSEKAHEDVTPRLIRHFKELIRTGTLTPGCRLPSERELAQNLGVNRASLRQALKVLQVMGVLDQRVGDGTYVGSDPRTILREPIEFLILLANVSHEDLFQFRLLIEPELVAIAARKASDAERGAMMAAIAALRGSRTTRQRLEADLAFHEAISRSAGNSLCMLILHVIQQGVLSSMEHSSHQLQLQKVVRDHSAIYRAIEKRSGVAARRAMIRHLRNSLVSAIAERDHEGETHETFRNGSKIRSAGVPAGSDTVMRVPGSWS
jgi:GntR family transcriptional repressor for pyruvate dehydrogenase complex